MGETRMLYCRNCGGELPEGSIYCPKCGTAVKVEAGYRLAFWGERFVAWLIDIIVLGALLTLIRWSFGSAWPGVTWGPIYLQWIPFIDLGLSNVIHFLYWMLMEGFYGQSLGKIIMRLEVTRKDGEPANLSQSAIQSIGKAFLLPIDCIVGWFLYPRRRQRLFNYLSETVVVKA